MRDYVGIAYPARVRSVLKGVVFMWLAGALSRGLAGVVRRAFSLDSRVFETRCRQLQTAAFCPPVRSTGRGWDESGTGRDESAGDHGTGASRLVGLEKPRRPWARPRATPEGLLGPGRGTADRDEKEVPVKPYSKKSSVVRCSRAAIEG